MLIKCKTLTSHLANRSKGTMELQSVCLGWTGVVEGVVDPHTPNQVQC